MRRTNSFEKTLILGNIEGGRRRGNRRWHGWMASPSRCTWVWVSSGNWWWTGRPGMLQSMALHRVDTTERMNWLKTQEDTSPKPATFVCRLDVYLGYNTSKGVHGNFLSGSDSEESACNAGDPSSNPGSGRSLREGNVNPFHYSCLENPMNRRT